MSLSASRRGVAAALVLAAALAVGLGARGLAKPIPETIVAARQKGPSDARVTIVEYSDFQCPACKVAEEPLRGILNLYGAQVKLVFKHFPLENIHPWARPAAVAAECAGRQGKFWEYHGALYDNQAEWGNEKAEEKLRFYAKSLGLDEAAFAACRADPSVKTAIDGDIEEARQRWVGSTPTFFINQKRFVGAKQLSERGTRWIEKLVKK